MASTQKHSLVGCVDSDASAVCGDFFHFVGSDPAVDVGIWVHSWSALAVASSRTAMFASKPRSVSMSVPMLSALMPFSSGRSRLRPLRWFLMLLGVLTLGGAASAAPSTSSTPPTPSTSTFADMPSWLHLELPAHLTRAPVFDDEHGTLQLSAMRPDAHLPTQLQALFSTAAVSMPSTAATTTAATKAPLRLLAEKSPGASRAPRVRGESRIFWYALGASALASLASRFVSIGPAVVAFAAFFLITSNAAVAPALAALLLGGLFAGYISIDAAIAALAGSFVFNSLSKHYKSNFWSGFLGQMAGNALAVSAIGLMVGFGLLYSSGVEAMAQFLAADFAQAVSTFSFIGLMPVAIISLFISVAVPAVTGAWGLSMGAKPADGFSVDPTWKMTPKAARRGLDAVAPLSRTKAYAPPRFTLLIPGT